MVGRSITLLTMSKKKKTYEGISTAFSKQILNALQRYAFMRVSVPLLFEQKKKKQDNVHVTHKHKTDVIHITKHKHVNIHNDAKTDIKTANNFFYKQEKISHKKINYIQQTRENKLFSYNYLFDEKKFSSVSHTISSKNEHNNNFVFTSKVDKTNVHNIENQESRSFIYSTQNEASHNTSVLQKVQNLVYKSENTTEVRLQEIENTVMNLTKVVNKPKVMQNSQTSSKDERVTYNAQLQEMSEKVYALVMKKYNSEQRRKGNLYA